MVQKQNKLWEACIVQKDMIYHSGPKRRLTSVAHLNWKCWESNLWPSISSNEGFLIRNRQQVSMKTKQTAVYMNQMLKCAFKTAEMYSVLVKRSMQKQNRDTNRIQDKTKCDNTTSSLIQHNWVWHTNRPNQPLKTEIRYTTIQKWELITSL